MPFGTLLAGGRGSRLGRSVPKALAMCAGRTLFERARDTMMSACSDLVVVAPAEMSLPHPANGRLADPEGGGGPLAAMVAGMASGESRAPGHEQLVLAVDLPLLTPESLLALRALRGDALAVVPRPNGVAQPLAAWYGPGAGGVLATLVARGERGVTRAVETLSPRWVDDDVLSRLPGGLDAWLNVNTPEELARAEARLMEAHR